MSTTNASTALDLIPKSTASYAELWDQEDLLQEYLSFEMDQMLQLSEFMKAVSAAEEAMNTQLTKIIKTTRDSMTKSREKISKPLQAFVSTDSTMKNTIDGFVQGVEKGSDMHLKMSEVLTKLRKNLKDTCKNLQDHAKQKFDGISKSNAEFAKAVDQMNRTKSEWLGELAQIESIKNQAKVKDKSKLEKRIEAAKTANLSFRTSIERVNAIKKYHYTVVIPEAFKDLQKQAELNRIGLTKDVIRQTCAYYLKTAPQITKNWNGVLTIANTVDPVQESSMMISKSKAKGEQQDLLDFEFSDSNVDIKKKHKVGDGREADLKSYDKDESRKKCNEKIKIIKDEMTEVQKHVDFIEVYISCLRENPAEKTFLEEVEMQRSMLLVKINNLLMKKHIYAAHLAIIDGKPPPLPPTMNSLTEFEQDAFSATSAANPKHLQLSSPLVSDAGSGHDDLGKLPTNYDMSKVEEEVEKELAIKSSHFRQNSSRQMNSVKAGSNLKMGSSFGSDNLMGTSLKSASFLDSDGPMHTKDGSLGINMAVFDNLEIVGDDEE